MKQLEPDFSKHSRLAQHLSILDLDDKTLPVDATAAEAARFESIHPRPLQLPRRKSRGLWYLGTFAMAAAALLLVFIRRDPEDAAPWTMKGAGSVQIFVEHEGQVKTLAAGEPLTAQDRIKAEVQATMPTLAFWGVTSHDGRLLSAPQWIWDNRLELEPLEKNFFAGSLQLEGPSEGETLCVILCPAELQKSVETAEFIAELSEMMALKSMSVKALKSCRISCAVLRP